MGTLSTGKSQTFRSYTLVMHTGQSYFTKVNHNCKSRANCNVITSAENDDYRFLDTGVVRRGGSALRSWRRAAPGPALVRGGARAGRRQGVEGAQRCLERPQTGVTARAARGRPPAPRGAQRGAPSRSLPGARACEKLPSGNHATEGYGHHARCRTYDYPQTGAPPAIERRRDG